MSNSVTLYLPPATDVVFKGFTNSNNLQRITITPESSRPIVFTGVGEENTLIGREQITTSPGDKEVAITVAIENSVDKGQTWKPSQIYSDACYVQAYNLAIVVSEDLGDEDFNDAVCFVSWPQLTFSTGI
jgi:hypothetical protein